MSLSIRNFESVYDYNEQETKMIKCEAKQLHVGQKLAPLGTPIVCKVNGILWK